ncbi:MAG TPA: hypothetical protein VK188_16930 [Holophaga sp.]|nr:hypothetical protein [Holophaga sp.]
MVLQSQRLPMSLLQVAGILMGLLLMLLTRHRVGWSFTNEMAGFLLGLLILVLSAAALAVGERRRVEIGREGIRLEVAWRWGRTRVVRIPAAEIRDIALSALGSASDGTRSWDLVVMGRDGRETHLLGGCAFEGRLDRDRMDLLRREARGLLGLGPA